MRACDGKFSEDAYYEMCLQGRYEQEYERYYHAPSHSKQTKQRLNRYAGKQIDKKKIEKLDKMGKWWTVSECETHKSRRYIGRRSKFHKRYSNRRVKQYRKYISSGGSYRKLYDYWWEVL